MTLTAARPYTAPARLQSLERAHASGGPVTTSPALDLVEQLIVAARHPDIAAIERYGPGQGPWGPTVEKSTAKSITGVLVKYQSSATASLWEAVWPDAAPVPAPDNLPPNRRAPRLPVFVAQLLDYAKPEQVLSWHLLAGPGVGLDSEQGVMPFGLGLVLADGSRHVLRATATGPTVGLEPTAEPFPEYVIPEGVRTCLTASAASAAPA